MSIFRFSAEFRFLFLLSDFFKIIFLFFFFFEKSHPPQKKKKKKNHYRHRHYHECSNSFGKQSVPSWFAGLCLLPFPVEVRKRRISTQFESAVSLLSGRSHAACWSIAWADGGRFRSDRKSSALRTPAFAHPPFPHSSHTHTHTHTLSLSLSLTHTHTSLIFRAANRHDFDVAVSPRMLHLCQKILQSEKSTWFYFSPRDSTPPPLSLSLSKQRPAAKSESNFDLY